MKKNITKIILFLLAFNAFADELDQGLSGVKVKDLLAPKEDDERTSPFAFQKGKTDFYQGKNNSSAESIVMGTKNSEEVAVKDLEVKKLKGSGYVLPGSMEKEKNYLALDKEQYAKDFRFKSTSAFNIAYFRDAYQYQSTNDVINRTIGQGYKHIKAGLIQIRSDRFLYKSLLLNIFWAGGGGISYNSGRGSFITGVKSETTMTFWEVPIDLGLGLEIPVYKWFKFTGTAGPSGMVVAQNRNDFQNGESGKNKFQFGYGQFANAQFKINMSGFSDNLAYDLFSSSQITNLSLNLEARFENYKNFQDNALAISGTSVGIGFTFEFL